MMMLVQPADESEQYHVASQAGRRQHFWLCLSTIKYGPSTSGGKMKKACLPILGWQAFRLTRIFN